MDTQEIIKKISTMELRIKTKAKINVFDRSLILADLLDMPKEDALTKILKIRENL